MRSVRLLGLLSAVLCLAAATAPARAATLSVIGPSTKVCQLTGQTDWDTGALTDAKTLSNYGLFGVDLGFPVENSTGQLLFLFGDNVPNGHPPGSKLEVPPDDAVGFTSRTAAPDPKTCLDLKIFSPGPGMISHPKVMAPIQQGAFDVPTGGIAVNGKLYAWFWTNHCTLTDPYLPNPTTPLVKPPAGAFCPENAVDSSIGRAVMAVAHPSNPLAFQQVAPLIGITYVPENPFGFVYVTAAQPPPTSGPPMPIPVFGVARYRASIPYLAMAPYATFEDFRTWKYYAGMSGGAPVWKTYVQWQAGHIGPNWAPPAGAELYADSPNPNSPTGDERCVGEHSVTWNAQLKTWLMLYTCGGWEVEARTAPEPWGPWSKPTKLLSAVSDPALFCTLFWNKPGLPCPGKVSQQAPVLTFGYLYAPFPMTRFTQALPSTSPDKEARIYWLLSTWDPYQVVVMQSRLKFGP